MLEKCPLAGGGWRPEIPDVCKEQCETLWDEAVQQNRTAGDYDIYRKPEDFDEWDGCNHNGTSLEYSCDGLQSVDASPKRYYTIVDQCMSCEGEFGEQLYVFDCPYN